MADAYTENLNKRKQDILAVAESFIARGSDVRLLMTKTSDTHLEHSSNLETIEKMLNKLPYANIGVIVGKESNLISFKVDGMGKVYYLITI